MKQWMKWSLFVIAVLIVGIQVYAVYSSGNEIGKAYVEWGQKNPFSPVDFYGGIFLGAMGMCLLFIAISIFELKRFEKEYEGPKGPAGSGGGGKCQVRLPMSTKVVDISKWQPPANTPMHRSYA